MWAYDSNSQSLNNWSVWDNITNWDLHKLWEVALELINNLTVWQSIMFSSLKEMNSEGKCVPSIRALWQSCSIAQFQVEKILKRTLATRVENINIGLVSRATKTVKKEMWNKRFQTTDPKSKSVQFQLSYTLRNCLAKLRHYLLHFAALCCFSLPHPENGFDFYL